MSQNEMDPAADTQQFRAFAQSGPSAESGTRLPHGAIVAAAVIAVVLVVVVAAIALT